jgi:hypothetical protein
MQAVKAALHMLENGACIEDAKSVCAPSDLFQLAKWKVQGNDGISSWLLCFAYTNYVLVLFFYKYTSIDCIHILMYSCSSSYLVIY